MDIWFIFKLLLSLCIKNKKKVMEQIIVLPTDVTVTYLMDINEIEIKINKETVIEKETGNLLIEKIFEELGNCGVIECNEINSTTDTWICSESKIYVITDKNVKELKEKGITQICYHGLIKDNIDLNNSVHTDFIMWYYNSDTVEESVENMNKTIE